MKQNDIDYIIYLMKKFTKSDTKKPRKKQGEIGEQGATAAPASGGGGGGGAKSPYPAVTKWTSGRKFGPTYNPDQKVWATGLTRGKANTLL